MARPPIEAEGALVELTVAFVVAKMVALKASLMIVRMRVTKRGAAVVTSPVSFNTFHNGKLFHSEGGRGCRGHGWVGWMECGCGVD